jgi:hypothetical protein
VRAEEARGLDVDRVGEVGRALAVGDVADAGAVDDERRGELAEERADSRLVVEVDAVAPPGSVRVPPLQNARTERSACTACCRIDQPSMELAPNSSGIPAATIVTLTRDARYSASVAASSSASRNTSAGCAPDTP